MAENCAKKCAMVQKIVHSANTLHHNLKLHEIAVIKNFMKLVF